MVGQILQFEFPGSNKLTTLYDYKIGCSVKHTICFFFVVMVLSEVFLFWSWGNVSKTFNLYKVVYYYDLIRNSSQRKNHSCKNHKTKLIERRNLLKTRILLLLALKHWKIGFMSSLKFINEIQIKNNITVQLKT